MSSNDIKKVMELVKERDVKYVDLRFTDTRGKVQHLSQHVCTMDNEAWEKGIMFDGSSIAGWKAINKSDMILLPDAATAVMDPFAAQPTLDVFCDVLDPATGKAYTRDPRSTAKRAEAFVKSSGIGDTCYFGPEAEFFIFDDVRFGVEMNKVYHFIDSEEGPYNTGRDYPEGNLGHRPP